MQNHIDYRQDTDRIYYENAYEPYNMLIPGSPPEGKSFPGKVPYRQYNNYGNEPWQIRVNQIFHMTGVFNLFQVRERINPRAMTTVQSLMHLTVRPLPFRAPVLVTDELPVVIVREYDFVASLSVADHQLPSFLRR
jgi:hypothetical protein